MFLVMMMGRKSVMKFRNMVMKIVMTFLMINTMMMVTTKLPGKVHFFYNYDDNDN